MRKFNVLENVEVRILGHDIIGICHYCAIHELIVIGVGSD